MPNIHQVARKILVMPKLPDLQNCGLCRLLYAEGAECAYHETSAFSNHTILPNYGIWTEQRILIICLLAETNPEDFQ